MHLPPRLQSTVRRHRRALAALVAAAAMLFALASLRSTPTSAQASADPASTNGLRLGEVAVPVTLASAALAATVMPGDVVDIVAVPEDGDASVLAPAARVLRSAAGGGLGAGSSSVVLLAVAERNALPLSAALDQKLTVVIRTG